ncbi:beta-glucosidase [Motilibacter peucedani]|uniref:Beta-glucosidase n=1 Tax=Motilibacter peucedani TaxID=598650 RepID=A0A420XUQ5_9ACTN|nr:exo 1,3/1,4-beta-D-glucan glucohydrolase [Motilibacter peucedani]RKS80558.1 beta-glucosidase [Motilibacter peucedani]
MTRRTRRRSTARGVAALAGITLLSIGVVAPAQGATKKSTAKAAATTIGAPAMDAHGCPKIPTTLPHLDDWPSVQSKVQDPKRVERQVAKILSGMTLAEKIGQMTQPEITSITAADVAQYHFGSILNGGGAWPGGNKHATQADWLALADAYWQASVTSGAKVPVIWGIDAVHGNNNVYGATLFPQNIGLGAAHDPCLVRDVEAATARQVRSTGQDWAFAPTLAVPQDDRWGRTYEGFSEDPRITRAYGYAAMEGLQGKSKKGPGTDDVIGTAKHYIGDGGTEGGKDQGVNASTEDTMINVHGQGYYGALAAGAQTVMASFNSWTNADAGIDEGKLHGSKKALTDILKQKMGFDGLVVSDWNGIGQVAGCTNASCPQAINAGIDVVMVPSDWKAFIENTTAQVQSGEIPMSRIDDAVSRILRVKIRSGVMTEPKPSARRYAGQSSALQDRKLARKAVRESAVLLKNNGNVLPLKPTAKVLVVGKSADNIGNQSGGWSLSWQGTGNTNADFPNATSILGGLQQVLGTSRVTFSETADGVDPSKYDAVIAVIGETPYAEGVGDIGKKSLQASRMYPEDLAVLDKVSGKGTPVVSVFLSGRPLWVNDEMNRSDAFVAGFLPGTEGGGIADLLVKKGNPGYSFTGTLSYSWPKTACQQPLNPSDEGYDPLFALGYGLKYGQKHTVGQLDETAPVSCATTGGGGTATDDLELFDRGSVDPYKAYIGGPDNWGGNEVPNDVNAVTSQSTISARTTDVNVQQDARLITWTGTGQYYLQSPQTSDLRGYLNADGAIEFDTIIKQAPTATTTLSVHCVYPCFADVPAKAFFNKLPLNQKVTVKLPLACLNNGNLDFSSINTAFLVYSEGPFQAAFANVRWVPGGAKDADAAKCSDFTP